MKHPDASRREFLRRASALSVLGGAAPWALQLAALGEAAAATATDYKALVCVFLYGGNDYGNTLPPYDAANHAAYLAQRPQIGTARDALTGTVLAPTTPLAGGRQYALAPELAPLVPLFDGSRMAVLLNLGTLITPTTKAQYQAKSVPLPPKLFSHNDQQSVWQSSLPEGSTSGWGGRIGDLFASSNGNATFTSVSVTGNTVYLAGRSTAQYQVSSSGSIAINGVKNALFGSTTASTALRNLISGDRTHMFEAELTRVTKRSIEANDQLTSALATTPALATQFPAGNSLATQLQMVARMIAARNALGAKRQVFFVSATGYDTHDSQLDVHPGLLTTLAGALVPFDAAMRELGVSDKVTFFTGSDFGRTLTSNGGGTDHGWGGHQFVFGGAVRGKAFYGTPPETANNGADDVGQGRLLPAMSIDQYGSTLARWFGLSDTEISSVLPNIVNFSVRDLAFLNAT